MKKVVLIKRKLIILGIIFLPTFMHAQNVEKCPDVVVLPKVLYDSFQIMKANLDGAENEIARDSAVREDILKRFLGCEKQTDVSAMLKQIDEAQQAAETNRKKWAEAFGRVDQEVRDFILAAHNQPVVYRFYDQGYGELGRVEMVTFEIQKGKVVIIPTFYDLPALTTRR
jgi:hypothetical protein